MPVRFSEYTTGDGVFLKNTPSPVWNSAYPTVPHSAFLWALSICSTPQSAVSDC